MGLITVSCVTLGKALPSLGLDFSGLVFCKHLGQGSLISFISSSVQLQLHLQLPKLLAVVPLMGPVPSSL